MTPDIQAIRERVKAATPGPWEIRPDKGYGDEMLRLIGADGSQIMDNEGYYPSTPKRDEDWQLIAHAPADLAALCDALEQRWIPVSERLPEQEQWVMCLLEHGTVCPTFVGGLPWGKQVTHWLPLPPAPPSVRDLDGEK